MSNKEELLVIEPIVGYRAWDIYCVKEKGKFIFRLEGTGAGCKAGFWIKGINIAKCINDNIGWYPYGKYIAKKKHKVPEFKCGCGFYAHKYKIDFIKELFSLSSLNYFYGMVELTGKVIEHSTGYRAEKAEIKKLIWCRDEDKISLSYENKDKKVKEKKEEKEKDNQENQVGGVVNAPCILNNINSLYQSSMYQAAQALSNAMRTFSLGADWSVKPSKTFSKDKILKQINEYYQVPIIYYKDYLEKELLK